ncbi:MAG: XTP/dITP diphosphatase [Anaerolineae bacterium]
MKLLIATHNRGKKAEYAIILDDLPLELVSLTDLNIDVEIAETGKTFEENALLKARGYAALTGLPTLADDSGLEVDALDGAPGIHSARYAGPEASDEDLYTLLLRNLRGVPDAERSARFRCVIALVWPEGREEVVEGTCEGRILRKPLGERGFGYDPIFYVPEKGKTMAQLPMEVKNRISHRGHAAVKAKRVLKTALA